MAKEFMTVTETAAKRVAFLLSKPQAVEAKALGLRLGVTSTGCSGHSYKMDYAGEEKPGDMVIDSAGGKIFIDMAAQMHIVGTEMDYSEKDMESGFIFNNPNVTAMCGCGQSFKV